MRVLAAPNADPPYDSPEPPRALAAGVVEQQVLPLLFVLPGGLPTDPDPQPDPFFDRQPSGTAELPEVHDWIARLSRAAVEVRAGARPLGQLRRWLSDEVYAQLLRSSRRRSPRVAEPRRRRAPDDQPARTTLRTVRTCEVADGRVEAAAVVDDGRRCWALALRLEGADGRWLCTALEVVA